MPSKALSISPLVAIAWWIGRPTSSASVFMALSPSCRAPTPILSSGRQAWPMRKPIQLAKLSFSQMSSHQAGLTRSPNHWCESSWLTTLPKACFWRVVAPLSKTMMPSA